MNLLDIININASDPVSFTFFTGYMAMLASAVFFFFERGRVADKWKTSMLVSGLITGIAAVHYYYMRDFYQATGETPVALRYIDWTLTVPLMCVEFYLITKKLGAKLALLWKLIAASVAMLVLGYIGEAFYADQVQSWVWGALSGLAYFYIVWLIWKGDVFKLAQQGSETLQKAVRYLAWFVLAGWAIYPLGYIAGTEGGLFGMRVLEGLQMDLVYNIGDAINKIGFGLVIYNLAINDKQ